MSTDTPLPGSGADPGLVPPSGPVPCAHCGLEVPRGLLEPGAERQFCCNGCRTVFDVIHGHGLGKYYELARDTSAGPRPASPTQRSYSDFDDPTFIRDWCRTLAGGRLEIDLYLENVHCVACVWLVEKLPLKIPGVEACELDIGRSRARLRWHPEHTPLSAVARFLDSLGYPAHPWRGSRMDEIHKAEDRRLLIRIAVAGAAAGNVMLIAFSLYGGHFSGMDDSFRMYFRWVSLLLTTPSVVWSGLEFYRGAWASLKARTLHMDLPITIGIGAGFLWGTWNTLTNRGEIYFDTLTVLIFLLLCGRWIVRRQQRSAADATELLYSLTPAVARRITGEGAEAPVVEIPLSALRVQDRVEVRAGDTVPADGQVEEGHSRLDLSLLTGESVPTEVQPGAAVFAGTLNVDGRLVIRVLRSGEDTRLGRLMQEIEHAASRRAPIVQLANRISGWFVAAVLTLAVLTFGLWVHAGITIALDNAIALLIVTCPCALGMATPLAVGMALGRAARRGILVRGADVIERLHKGGELVLDKTGTLTEGQLGVVRILGDAGVLPWVAALERNSAHPVARAFTRACGEDHLPAAMEVQQAGGRGISGVVEGHTVLAGSLSHLKESGLEPDAALAEGLPALLADALTPIAVAVDGRIVAVFGLGDRLRSDAAETLERLRRRGWKPRILSGDHPAVVQAIGRQLGLAPEQCRGAVSPEGKLHTVEDLARRGPVMMVGDGVNDAAALAAATVGVSVRGGAEASLAAADVYLSRPGLLPLAELVQGAGGTVRTIQLNLAFSLAYNLVGAGLAMAGILNPLLAAVLMPVSSITVVLISLNNRSFRPPR